MAKLFDPIRFKNISLNNRIVMSPMCQYSAKDGFADEWHLVHYGSRAVGGCGAIIQEATAVSPEGRISHGDLGIWDVEHLPYLKKITSFIEKMGSVPGIQLAHAGRKASCDLPWSGGAQLKEGVNSWQTVSSSTLPFHLTDNLPIELSEDGIQKVIADFKTAAICSVEAGYKIIEIHAAHGYLIHQFLSPLSNLRTDSYGGGFENRIRFLLEIIDAVNFHIDDDHSLWVRISATDWVEGGWNLEESVELAKILKTRNVDVVDVSTGGNVSNAHIPVAPDYQIPFAEKLKTESGILVGAVGLITDPFHANELIQDGKCDLVLLGRELLRNPYFAIDAAVNLGEEIPCQIQYKRSC